MFSISGLVCSLMLHDWPDFTDPQAVRNIITRIIRKIYRKYKIQYFKTYNSISFFSLALNHRDLRPEVP